MRYLALIMLGLALGLTGCPDEGPTPDAGTDAGTNADAGIEGRLERPPVLPRPPEGGLPAELFPPR
jgi:hypothetical protein